MPLSHASTDQQSEDKDYKNLNAKQKKSSFCVLLKTQAELVSETLYMCF